jgi:predicted amidophosphoribosyltransferase
MKITETLILAAVLAAGLGCGYSKKTTPPALVLIVPRHWQRGRERASETRIFSAW